MNSLGRFSYSILYLGLAFQAYAQPSSLPQNPLIEKFVEEQSSPTSFRQHAATESPGTEIRFTWKENASEWEYDSTLSFEYDLQGNITHQLIADTLTGDSMSRRFSVYNSENFVVSDSVEIWQNGIWANKELFKFDYYDQVSTTYSPDRCWSVIHPSLKEGSLREWNSGAMSWDTAVVWRFGINFSPAGQELDWTWSFWNADTPTYSNFAREIFQYNSDGQLQRRTCQNWLDSLSSWVNRGQILYTYKTSGRKDVEQARLWDPGGGQWQTVYRFHRYMYDSLERIINFEQQTWNGSQWINFRSFQTIYAPDSISYVHIQKRFENNLWINLNRQTVDFDAQRNQSANITQEWDTTFNLWSTTSGTEYLNFYDPDDRMTEQITRVWDPYQGFFINERRSLFRDYPAVNVGNEGIIDLPISLAPNPTSSHSILKWGETAFATHIHLLDFQGRTVYSQSLLSTQKQVELDLSALPAGIYVVRMTSDLGIWSQRLLKR